MRNQSLTGYVLHARPYQEKRAIYQIFSREWGVVQGVGSRGVPSFVLIELFANGQKSLKNFSQTHLKSTLPTSYLGQNQYALLYLNELLCKLIAPEDPCPNLWQAYHDSIQHLQTNPSLMEMKVTLRAFEKVLFDELGVGIEWGVDSEGHPIDVLDFYKFIPNHGFEKSLKYTAKSLSGEMILKIDKDIDFDEKSTIIGQVHRMLIDELLEYKPLNSRKLWAEQFKYR